MDGLQKYMDYFQGRIRRLQAELIIKEDLSSPYEKKYKNIEDKRDYAMLQSFQEYIKENATYIYDNYLKKGIDIKLESYHNMTIKERVDLFKSIIRLSQ